MLKVLWYYKRPTTNIKMLTDRGGIKKGTTKTQQCDKGKMVKVPHV